VTPGEEKWVRILEIDEERRRISLSIKRAETGNTAFSDLIPDELKQQAQEAREENAAAAAPEEPAVAGGADVPDLDLSEEVFTDAPPAAAEAEQSEPAADEPAPAEPAAEEAAADQPEETPPADEA
jgi:small subunit ribosomal protein S1